MENQIEIKTTSDIYVETTHLIRVAEYHLAGQSHNDFLHEVTTKKWVSVESIINELESLEPIGGSDVDFPLIYELICHLKNYESKDSSLNKDLEKFSVGEFGEALLPSKS